MNPLEAVLRDEKERNAGELTPIGCTAEQRSCTKPGKGEGRRRVPPPMEDCASSTVVEMPARWRVMAAVSPLGPEPIT